MASKKTVEFDADAYLAQANQKTLNETAAFNPDDYLLNAGAPSPQLTPEMAGLKQEANTPGLNPLEQVGIAAEGMYQKGKEMLVTMGLRGAPVALGETVGQRLAGKPGALAGREAGAIVGSLLDQGRLVAQGKQQNIEGGQIIQDMTGALMPGNARRSPLGQMVTRGAIQGGLNVAGEQARSLVDTGNLSPFSESAAQFSAGAASPFVQRGMQGLLGARGPVLTRNEQTFGPGQYEAFRAVRPYGIKVPPHELGRGSDTLSGLGGKTATQQLAAKENVFGFQKMVNEAVGIKDSARPLFDSDLENIRRANYAPYERIKEISSAAKEKLDAIMAKAPKATDGPSTASREDFLKAQKSFIDPLLVQASADVDQLKIVRNMASKARQAMNAGDPTGYERLQGHLAKMDELNENILQAAQLSGDKNLLNALNTARKNIAVSYAAQDIINPATGLANPAKAGAKVLGREVGFREIENGVKNKSPLKKMGDFALSFHPESVEAVRVPAPGVNNLNPNLQLGMLSQGTPQGALAAIISKMGGPVRRFNLSEYMQNRIAQPETELGWADFNAQLAQRMTAQAAK